MEAVNEMAAGLDFLLSKVSGGLCGNTSGTGDDVSGPPSKGFGEAFKDSFGSVVIGSGPVAGLSGSTNG